MKLIIYILAMTPMVLLPDALKAIDPYDVWAEITGTWLVVWLSITLLLGPVGRLLKKKELFFGKQPLGIATGSWLILHIGGYFVFHSKLADSVIDLITKPYLLIGVVGALILLKMMMTSNKWFIKKLGRGWNVLHSAGVFAAALGVGHAITAQKTTFATGGIVALTLLVAILLRYLIEYRRVK